MTEHQDDGTPIFGPGDAIEGLLHSLENYTLWTGSYRHKGEDVMGYLIVNNHTGIVEAEGSNMPNSMIAMYYLEKRYIRVMDDPEAEMDRQSQAMDSMASEMRQFHRMFEDDDDDGSRH